MDSPNGPDGTEGRASSLAGFGSAIRMNGLGVALQWGNWGMRWNVDAKLQGPEDAKSTTRGVSRCS